MLAIRSWFLLNLTLVSLCSAAPVVETQVEVARESERGRALPTEQNSEKLAPLPNAAANSEFGEQVLVVRQAVWDPWRFDSEVSGFYTDNAALAPHRVEDFFMETGLGATYRNRISGPWSLEASLRQAFIRYDRFDSLSFDLTKARAGLAYKAGWLADASFTLRYQFDYLSEPEFGSHLLDTHSLALGLVKSWKLGNGQQVFWGLVSEPELVANPDVALRHRHALYAGWSVRLTERLTARLTGRVGYHTSPNADRDDWHYIAAASATYAFTDWASLGLSSSLTWNRSSKDSYDYRNLLSGASLGLQLKF